MSSPKVVQRSPFRHKVSLRTVNTNEINVEPSGRRIISECFGRKANGVVSSFAEQPGQCDSAETARAWHMWPIQQQRPLKIRDGQLWIIPSTETQGAPDLPGPTERGIHGQSPCHH